MTPYENLLQRLRTSDSDAVGAGQPASAEEVAEAERRLGVSFPPSYRRFLEVLGALDVPPDEVFGLPGGVVSVSLEARTDGEAPAGAVVIGMDAVEGVPVGFVPAGDGAEPEIVRWQVDGAVPVAVDFGDYLATLVESALPVEATPSRIFDPPWGQRRAGGSVEADRKEVKIAFTLVQRISYDGVTFARLVEELNSRRVRARHLPAWTIEAAREAYETWKDRY